MIAVDNNVGTKQEIANDDPGIVVVRATKR